MLVGLVCLFCCILVCCELLVYCWALLFACWLVWIKLWFWVVVLNWCVCWIDFDFGFGWDVCVDCLVGWV